jgi:hypothetical protein
MQLIYETYVLVTDKKSNHQQINHFVYKFTINLNKMINE